ncbi:MAG TPA: carboxypeptidase regulatory-like domain-containing protein [Candidatus Acidoferrales bacterium]|nr:carboxypeptidase regulatory-like domain-containing protein [Candidatus Acidoferrales bacterium]
MTLFASTNRMYAIVLLMILGVFGIYSEPGLRAQVTGGTIQGTVSDATGAAIPNVDVLITNVSTNEVTTLKTNEAGLYSAPNLLPGPYKVTSKSTGFSTAVVNGIDLTVGAQQAINITMKVGETSQQVEVSASAVAIETASSEISDVVSGPAVRELPLNGRSWTDLAQLQPGVNAVHTQAAANTTDRASRGWGAVITISGARPTQNNYRLDGISLNDSFNAAPGSFLAGNLGVDAIGEFSVLTGNFPAEYGKSSGGVINAITKSGTNQIHGSAYEFMRNSAADAKNFFDPAGPTPPFRRNQFGASVGLPIQKDKMFFFADYEGLRQFVSSTNVSNVPTALARTGVLSSGTVAVNPLTAPYLPLWPLPNAPGPNVDVGRYNFAGLQETPENYGIFRIDRKISDKDSLFGTFSLDRQSQASSDSLNDLLTNRFLNRYVYAIGEDHTFSPSFVNVVRLGYYRENISSPSGATPINPITANTSLGLTPGQTIGRIIINGLTTFQGGLTLWQTTHTIWNSYQGTDDIFITKGKHQIKMGVAIEKDQRNTGGPGGFAGGWTTFPNFQAFLADAPSSLIANSGPGDLSYHLSQWIPAAYVEDVIHVTPRLTATLGLRYEFATALDSKGTGTISSLQCQACEFPILREPITENPALLALVNSAFQMEHQNPVYGPLIAHMPRDNFAPRVGLAWDPFGDGKTSVRAAFGVYDVLIQFPNYGSAIGSSWPGLQSTNSAAIAPGTWPSGTFSTGSANLNTKRVDYIQQNPPTNYVMQWNLNVQHQFTNSLTVSVAYVGTRSVHNVFQMDDSNVALPINFASGTPLWPCGVFTPPPAGQPFNPAADCSQFSFYQGPLDSAPVAGHRLNPYVGREPTQLYDSSGIYHGLQMGVLKSAGHGLTVSGSYTFSKNITTSDGSGIGDPYVNSISSNVFWFRQALRRGLSDTNITHNFVMSYMYNVPNISKGPSYLQPVINGWETGGILTIQSGQPFTPQISGDSIGENNTDPINFPDRLGGAGCQSLTNPGNVDNYIKLQCFAPAPPVFVNGTAFLRVGNLGRNTVIGPGLMTMDFSLFKNNYIRRISETFNAQFRFEAFNVFNRPNFSPPTDNQFLFNADGTSVPGAGAIDLTTTTSRQLQAAVKIIF